MPLVRDWLYYCVMFTGVLISIQFIYRFSFLFSCGCHACHVRIHLLNIWSASRSSVFFIFIMFYTWRPVRVYFIITSLTICHCFTLCYMLKTQLTTTLSHHRQQVPGPSDWLHRLHKVFSDFFCSLVLCFHHCHHSSMPGGVVKPPYLCAFGAVWQTYLLQAISSLHQSMMSTMDIRHLVWGVFTRCLWMSTYADILCASHAY